MFLSLLDALDLYVLGWRKLMGNSADHHILGFTIWCPLPSHLVSLFNNLSAKDKRCSLTGYLKKVPLFCTKTKLFLLTLIRYYFTKF